MALAVDCCGLFKKRGFGRSAVFSINIAEQLVLVTGGARGLGGSDRQGAAPRRSQDAAEALSAELGERAL